jgi:EAL domain-containing protein (putative c-di-GMP-specific phosphodiesterase class I)
MRAIMCGWNLIELGPGEGLPRAIDLPPRSIVIGRLHDADVTISLSGVSKRHARIDFADDHLIVEDLGSTNGTRVNGKLITRTCVQVGDLLQFANAVYRVGRHCELPVDGTIEEGFDPCGENLFRFDQLLAERAVIPHFQPIVRIADRECRAFEVLARSDIEGLSNPAEMFAAAERLGLHADLSELMRCEGLSVARSSQRHTFPIFLNTHPDELITERLINSLLDLRERFPSEQVAIEVHESGVTDPGSMRAFMAVLRELGMQLAYDDFGAGQGRLLELTEVPPDVLKFDMRLIRGIDSAPSCRQDLLGTLVKLAKNEGTQTLAEGVETEAEHEACRQMGFDLGQGFLYGRPCR